MTKSIQDKLIDFQSFLYGYDGQLGKNTVYNEFIKQVGDFVDDESIEEWDEELERLEELDEEEDFKVNLFTVIFSGFVLFIVLFLGIAEMQLKGNHNFIWAMGLLSGLMLKSFFHLTYYYFTEKDFKKGGSK